MSRSCSKANTILIKSWYAGEVLELGKFAEASGQQEMPPIGLSIPDLKEMFSLGPSNPRSGFPARIFPSQPSNFESTWREYYKSMESLALVILSAFATALELPNQQYFEDFLDHHACTIRYYL